ncbi:MAG: porphobilinogen synthase [Proteobacteria bacterium]|nr:porphobilinogen synthase [Pseudomonadota bacterium]
MPHSPHSQVPGQFPQVRLRRPRMQGWSRAMVAEHALAPSDLILPLFVQEGRDEVTPIAAMPGVSRLTIDRLVEKARQAHAAGIPAVALFPKIDESLKSPLGDEALFEDNLVCRAIRALKDAVPELGVIADVALDPYTSHGHDGIVEDGQIKNDATVEVLVKQAAVLARAGCDVVAPSDMMDGRVGAIRAELDTHGFADTQILAYSAKYASAFYGPFREAVDSARFLGGTDKRSYQMDPANGAEAMREIALDVAEGADYVMVKPGIAYLDIVYRAAQRFDVPVLAYQVSGEYAMIQAAAQKGWVDGNRVMLESLLAFKRAGARAILSYAALDVAEIL